MKYLFPIFCGVLVWLFATLFFVFLGEYVLFAPGTSEFLISLILLLVGTAILLFVVTKIYLLFDHSVNASLKFGIIGTVIGLSLDMFSLSNYQTIFSKLDLAQVIAFCSWMSFAYALYILIPLLMNLKKAQFHEIKN